MISPLVTRLMVLASCTDRESVSTVSFTTEYKFPPGSKKRRALVTSDRNPARHVIADSLATHPLHVGPLLFRRALEALEDLTDFQATHRLRFDGDGLRENGRLHALVVEPDKL